MRKDGCVFCVPDASVFPHFAENGVDQLDKYHAMESENFAVKFDILPARQDGLHFLLHPKFHELTHSRIDSRYDYEVGQVLYRLEQKVGELTIMEHGDVDEANATIMSVRHAHSHLFPSAGFNLAQYMHDELDGQGIAHQMIDTPHYSYFGNLRRHFANRPYMYVQQGGVGLYALEDHGNIKSQTIQRETQAFWNNGATFDWKKIGDHPDWGGESVKRLQRAIERCKA